MVKFRSPIEASQVAHSPFLRAQYLSNMQNSDKKPKGWQAKVIGKASALITRAWLQLRSNDPPYSDMIL